MAFGLQENPKRGPQAGEGVAKRLRFCALGNSSPPSVLNCETGSSGIGFLAYAAAAAALIGFGVLKSKPLVERLYRSVVGSSCSTRSPRLRVRLVFTRKSSWR